MTRSLWMIPAAGVPVAVLIAAWTNPQATAERDRPTVHIEGIPHVQQRPDFCGEACAEMYLRKLNTSWRQDDVFQAAGVDPALGRGCHTRDLAKALRTIGFDTGPVWHYVPPHSDEALDLAFQSMYDDLASGVPSIVCMRYDRRPDTTEHFRLVIGFDSQSDEVLYHEPAAADGSTRRMQRMEFLRLWPLKYQNSRWTVIRLRLDSGPSLHKPQQNTGHTDADFAQHVRRLKTRLPDGFHIRVQKPFVVIGDESAASVARRAEGTVKWSVDRIKRDYFTYDPEDIIDIWLFKDKASYEQHTWELFQDRPSTPYGYYSPSNRALVMNIRTGGGTLVHEIVHPFVASNFARCPSWFNEGLASLYEQCGDRDGHIWGHTNWRLAGLQRAIKQDAVPTFQHLCETSSREFYRDRRGTNYAQARYLCYYLQEKGLLVKYYHAFRRNVATDPSGYKTLQATLADDDMTAFQEKWEKYVSKLTF